MGVGAAADDTGGVHAERGTWGARPSWGMAAVWGGGRFEWAV